MDQSSESQGRSINFMLQAELWQNYSYRVISDSLCNEKVFYQDLIDSTILTERNKGIDFIGMGTRGNRNQLNKLNDWSLSNPISNFCLYSCMWKNGERLPSSDRFFASLLKGFLFRHHNRSIPLVRTNMLLLFVTGTLNLVSRAFFLDSACIGEDNPGSTDLALVNLSNHSRKTKSTIITLGSSHKNKLSKTKFLTWKQHAFFMKKKKRLQEG